MSISSLPARCRSCVNSAVAFLKTVTIVGAFGLALPVTLTYAQTVSVADVRIAAAAGSSILPFRMHVPEASLVELRQRLRTTRRPDKDTVNDESQSRCPVRRAQIRAGVRLNER
jgi:hypothetical protein